MTPSTLNWAPEPQILQALEDLAHKRGQPLDALLTEAIVTYLNAQKAQETEASLTDPDSLIGLFAGSSDLSTQSEEVLQQEIKRSGWTWKWLSLTQALLLPCSIRSGKSR